MAVAGFGSISRTPGSPRSQGFYKLLPQSAEPRRLRRTSAWHRLSLTASANTLLVFRTSSGSKLLKHSLRYLDGASAATMTGEEARIAGNIAKVPDLLQHGSILEIELNFESKNETDK